MQWEAIATVSAAIVVTVGAVIVGSRQVGIAKRQVEILAQQASTEHLKLKIGLFDRRLAVFVATKEFIYETLHHTAGPDANYQAKFLSALNVSGFLFAPSVQIKLDEVRAKSWELFAVLDESNHRFQTTGDYGSELIARKWAIIHWLSETFSSLVEVFGTELVLQELHQS